MANEPTSSIPNAPRQNVFLRFRTYFAERFPLAAHGPLIFAFSLSAVCLSALLRSGPQGAVDGPSAAAVGVAFAGALVFFLQLRIADEFKDAEEDARWQPQRAVPRGLVTLRELAGLFMSAGAMQLGLTLLFRPTLAPWLFLVWTYLGLMSKEFFVGEWLRRRPILYMTSHMLIMPCIDLYASACDWLQADDRPPAGLEWFLLTSYVNGLVIELGRKIRGPEEERPGVSTYSVLWGPGRAVAAWWFLLLATALFAAATAHAIGAAAASIALSSVILAVAGFFAYGYAKRPCRATARPIEILSAVWTLLLYLSLGPAPLVWRRWTS